MRLVKHVGLILAAVLMAWGCNENGTKPQPKQSNQEEKGQSPQEESLQTPAQQQQQQQAPASGEPDAYGRMPGDAHYGHDHPLLEEELINRGQQGSSVQQGSPVQVQQGSPVQTQQAAPTSGEPDKYGRLPGDEHYGHDHP